MKRIHSRLLAAALALALALGLSGGALAAETGAAPAPAPAKPIAVQLNGQELAFPDAAPEAVNGRTFLPVRPVFEALGAQVSYSPSAQTITAVRDGTTVTMALGSTAATVETDGVKTTLTMDAAPYAKNNRTYVPVRFAAQALGCAVGWDQGDSTVILVDVRKLLSDTLSKYSYTYLERYADYAANAKYNEGAWAATADMDASFAMMGLSPLTMTGSLDGVIADASKAELSMNLKLDMEDFLADLAEQSGQEAGFTAEERALLAGLKKDGVGMELRADLESGMYYMTYTGDLMEQMGLPAGTWISMDLSPLFEQMGMDPAQLTDPSQTLQPQALAYMAASLLPPMTDKDGSYAMLAQVVDTAAKFLADESFVKDGDKLTSTLALQQGADKIGLTLALETDGDKVVGYGIDLDFAADLGAGPDGSPISMALALSTGVDAKDHMYAHIALSATDLIDLTLDVSGDYAPSSKAPRTEPPAGADVITLEELMGAEGVAGPVSGAAGLGA